MTRRTGRRTSSEQTDAQEQPTERAQSLEWLLSFQAQELGNISIDEGRDIGERLSHIAWQLVGAATVFPAIWLRTLERHRGSPKRFLAERQDEAKFRDRLPRLSRRKIQNMKKRLRAVLETLFPSDPLVTPEMPWIQYPSIPTEIRSVHLMNDKEKGGITRVYGADWSHLYWLSIASLLEEFGADIRRCLLPDCRRLFLRCRRQAYCSQACSLKKRSRDWYQAHQQEARRKRRHAYKREVQKSRPGARVTSRIRDEGTVSDERGSYVHRDYPSWRFHRDLPDKLVKNSVEDAALGSEWRDTPWGDF